MGVPGEIKRFQGVRKSFIGVPGDLREFQKDQGHPKGF